MQLQAATQLFLEAAQLLLQVMEAEIVVLEQIPMALTKMVSAAVLWAMEEVLAAILQPGAGAAAQVVIQEEAAMQIPAALILEHLLVEAAGVLGGLDIALRSVLVPEAALAFMVEVQTA
jgi:hypothetical protein